MSNTGRISLQPACVLHRRPYSDTSFLVELFTPDYGRVGIIAKGARRRAQWSSLLQPFNRIICSWSGRGELKTLVHIEREGSYRSLQGTALISGFYLNELLMRLLQREDPHPHLHASYLNTLDALNAPGQTEWALRLFEHDLLRELGYGLLLDTDSHGVAIQYGTQYCYHLESGPSLAMYNDADCLRISGSALLALAEREPPSKELMRECKRLMRAALGLYLGDRPLASRELFRQQYRSDKTTKE